MAEVEKSIGGDVTLRGGNTDILAVIDQYEIVKKLGGGGFGSVYLAEDTVAGIEVAVKGLPPVVKNNSEELERIRSNFALVCRLHHPNIAAALVLHPVDHVAYRQEAVCDDLAVKSGDTLMVMEYAPGSTLSQWMKQYKNNKAPLEIAVDIVSQIASALDFAHSRDIIHRDIKPSNVMVATKPDGGVVVRVLDFGLAAQIRSSMGRVSMQVCDTSGTRPYMAPEQWSGSKQGPATDQYALAVLFVELITGEVPFASAFDTGDPLVMMAAVCNREPELPVGCPHVDAIRKALNKKPDMRFGSCGEFASALGGMTIARAGKKSSSEDIGGIVNEKLEKGKDLYWGRNGTVIDYCAAANLFRELSEQGVAEAVYYLGRCFANGEGVVQDDAKAVEYYRRAAELDDADSQLCLGGCYENGTGVEKDDGEASRWYSRAVRQYRKLAEHGDAHAQNKLGECYLYGQDVDENDEEAVKWFRIAADHGNVEAQLNLAHCYELGSGVDPDETSAFEWYRKAAEQGNLEAEHLLGCSYLHGKGVEKDETRAVKWFRKAAECGGASAQAFLGDCYKNGRGVGKDEVEAVKWYRKAIERGRSSSSNGGALLWASNGLGVCYLNGLGTDKNEREAVSLFRVSAEMGLSDARFNLAMCYDLGTGVDKNASEALKWYQLAAEQGHADAQVKLGDCYKLGKGISKDAAEAFALYKKSAEQGNHEAMRRIGDCYANGEGVDKDEDEATEWYRAAAEAGSVAARQELDSTRVWRILKKVLWIAFVSALIIYKGCSKSKLEKIRESRERDEVSRVDSSRHSAVMDNWIMT